MSITADRQYTKNKTFIAKIIKENSINHIKTNKNNIFMLFYVTKKGSP